MKRHLNQQEKELLKKFLKNNPQRGYVVKLGWVDGETFAFERICFTTQEIEQLKKEIRTFLTKSFKLTKEEIEDVIWTEVVYKCGNKWYNYWDIRYDIDNTIGPLNFEQERADNWMWN